MPCYLNLVSSAFYTNFIYLLVLSLFLLLFVITLVLGLIQRPNPNTLIPTIID